MGFVQVVLPSIGACVTFNSLYGILPLWDSYLIILIFLSIPFMGFVDHTNGPSVIFINFQFPLWDSVYVSADAIYF